MLSKVSIRFNFVLAHRFTSKILNMNLIASKDMAIGLNIEFPFQIFKFPKLKNKYNFFYEHLKFFPKIHRQMNYIKKNLPFTYYYHIL